MSETTEAERYVGKAIRETRQAQKLSLATLGERVGVSYQQISKYETCENRVTVDVLVRLAAALHVPVTELMPKSFARLSDNRAELRRQELVAFVQSKPGRAILHAFQGMDGRQKRAFALVAQTIAGQA